MNACTFIAESNKSRAFYEKTTTYFCHKIHPIFLAIVGAIKGYENNFSPIQSEGKTCCSNSDLVRDNI